MRKICFVFILLIFSNINKTFAVDNVPSSSQTAQITIGNKSDTLTINSGITLGNLSTQQRAYINEKDDVSVTVNSGGSILSLHNAVQGYDSDDLTVTNTGTIRAAGSKAINLKDTAGSTITNNLGGIIRSGAGDSISGEAATGVNIENNGTIYSDSERALNFFSTSTATVTNNSSGHIYNSNTNEAIKLDGSSTLTNSGKIENKNSASNNSIRLVGNDNTIILKDKGILVGTIDAGSTTGNTLKFQHGMGQGYYYKTSGDFTLQDLDGNQVVKGSAGSVGQGASETLDELLSYKSINLRNFFNEYNKLDNQDAWGETYVSNLKRDAHTNNLALEYDLTNFGVNLINKSKLR